MASEESPYLDILVDLPDGRRIKLSLPNRDVSVDEIVRGLINENYLARNHKYRMSQLLTREQKIYDIAEDASDFFVIFEDKKKEGFKMSIDNKKIFVVHGHTTGLRETVARFLEKLGAQSVILEEEPSRGMTVIEKLEEYSDVGYAVILMMGDDRGGTKDITFKNQRPRARQNVIFELGYFLSKLGRERVCVLYEQGVEIPSDYAGVIYVPYDEAGGWKLKIARELNAVGLDIDIKKLVTP